jgi:hypothetical protein
MPDYTTKLRVIENQRKPCVIPGCIRHRDALQQYCATHAANNRLYGSPAGRNIREAEIKPYRRQARKFLRTYASHPAVLEAVAVMGELLQPGPPREKRSQFSARYFLRLHLQRLADSTTPATGLEALTEVLAVWFFSYFNRRALPDDRRLTFATARAVLYLRPLTYTRERWNDERQTVEKSNPRLPGAGPTELLGRAIRRRVGVFLTHCTDAIEADYQQRNERAKALNTPI